MNYAAYRDPLTILMRKEEKSCKGCTHYTHTQAFGQRIDTCAKGRNIRQRCKLYKEAA